ncbi:MAG: HAMP domain-containing sensor histidine kinase [Acidobacteria bacterium]|nr:HAMP domain-containing sensor histidine kinase [Acidobacteriota bacterium]
MSKTPSPRWYRSLYWRMGLGLFAFLALMLAAQGALLLWLADRMAGSMPATSPQRLADLVASDIGTALGEDPALDLQAYVREHYDNVFQSFVVVMRDGRTVANHDDLPDSVRELLRAEAQRRPPPDRRFPARGFGAGRGGRQGGEPSGTEMPPSPRPPRERPGLGTFREGFDQRRAAGPRAALSAIGDFSPIAVDNVLVGRVAVLTGRPPFSRIVRALGPTMGVVGGGVLAVGGALVAFVVFGPVRRRLRGLQDATERLGRGDQTARAPEHGGDEVAAVAGSFNRMADELGTRAEALKASDQARRQLLADVSHELNTPLTAMRGYLETIAMPHAALDQATRERYFGIVMEETHRLERIIGDLLDLARLDGSGTAMQHGAVSVPALFERVAMRHEHDLHTHGVTLVRRVGPEADSVVGDANRLEQALQNLAANALRHTPSGGTITLSAERAGPHLRIRVEDTGPGIAPEHLSVIFDRFYKADNSRTAGGSGLGLSIVKAIVERHGGTVTARNEQGALFEILLPAESLFSSDRSSQDSVDRSEHPRNGVPR